VLVTPCPTLEQLGWGTLVRPARAAERDGWPPVHVIDRRADDPRSGLFSARLVELVRSAEPDRRVVCVLNRKGRSRLLVCAACQTVAACERCGAVVEVTAAGLRCRQCGTERPSLCATCGANRFKALRVGVTRVRAELEALAQRPVGEVTAEARGVPDTPVLVGTEAVLHRVSSAAVVVFLDFDAELLAPRYRAAEQALALLARAGRVVGGREAGGLLAVQTRMPAHSVVTAAVRADPERVATAERSVREALALPPVTAVALLSGDSAAAFADALAAHTGVDVVGDAQGHWLVRAPDHRVLCDTLAAVPRPAGRLRIEVDPLRI
jgi:primosomal protein N' (replication factor Y)